MEYEVGRGREGKKGEMEEEGIKRGGGRRRMLSVKEKGKEGKKGKWRRREERGG